MSTQRYICTPHVIYADHLAERDVWLTIAGGAAKAERERCAQIIKDVAEEYVGDEYAQGNLALRVAVAAIEGSE